MSDQRLRDLERRWRQTRALEDEAAYLLERVRTGELTQERLELAAYCGHEGARKAHGHSDRWNGDVASLSRWGVRCLAVAAVTVAARAVDALTIEDHEAQRIIAVLTAVEAWVRSPSADSLARVKEAEANLDGFEAADERTVETVEAATGASGIATSPRSAVMFATGARACASRVIGAPACDQAICHALATYAIDHQLDITDQAAVE